MEFIKEKSVCKEHIFKGIYARNSTYLYNFVFYKCGDTQKSEDIVQEAFIKLWDNCKKVILEKAKSFLFTVANNLFLNDAQHQKVKLNYHKRQGIKDKTNETPEFLLEEKEYMEKLEEAIANLTDGQREVFLLNRIDGLKYKEIAEILGISIKAVEKRMHGALVQLRITVGNI